MRQTVTTAAASRRSLRALWIWFFAVLALASVPSLSRANIDPSDLPVVDAAFVSQSVPTSMVAGQSYSATVTIKNTGQTTWAAGFSLGSQNPQDNVTWGRNRVAVWATTVTYQQITFTIPITAPSTPGTYNFQWQMIQEGVTWFGQYTPNVVITVTPPPVNNAAFVSQTVPATMIAGQTYSATMTMQNTGNTTWTAASNYRLGSQNPADNVTWGTNRVAVAGSVAPGQQTSFTIPITAPSTPGTYNFQWQMGQDGVAWFGGYSPNVVITVNPPPVNNAAFVSQSVPTSMVAGQAYSATVTMQNTGNTTWTGGTNFKLGSQNPQDNGTWGTGRVNVVGSVAPGQQYTFAVPITAPSTTGTYNFQWRMLQEGVNWFGGYTPNVAVTVNGPITVPPTSSSGEFPGKTADKLIVGNTGEAVYTVPIEIPPGSGGMAPKLALQYTSGSGNGTIGVGWSLAGIDLISRCARDQFHDGNVAGVNLTTDDRLCMNGQRLVAITGAYGAVGTEYRTDVHDFAKIVATAVNAFTVTTRDGTKSEYGTTADSLMLLPGASASTPYAWALSKVTDARGNYYTITYNSSAASGQQTVSRIDYTGNGAAGLAPYNSVRFVYDSARPDVEWQYVAGYKVVGGSRLTRIETYSGASLARSYTLSYDTSPITGRSRVQNITQCFASGACLRPTWYAWENTSFVGTAVTTMPGTDLGDAPYDTQGGTLGVSWGEPYWQDVNGDGRADYCLVVSRAPPNWPEREDQMWCALTQPGGAPAVVVSLHTWNVPAKSPSSYSFVDLNGDGILDVCGFSDCVVMSATGPTGTVVNGGINSGAYTIGDMTWWTDINGDGVPDFCSYSVYDGTLKCSLRTTTGPNPLTTLAALGRPSCFTATQNNCGAIFSWADVSGDGVQSFCIADSGALRCRKWTPAGLAAEISVLTDIGSQTSRTADQSAWVDFNGDGKMDFCRVLTNGTQVACTLSTGTGFGETITSPAIDVGLSSYRLWADVNGDGKADFCRSINAAFVCLKSLGNAFGSDLSYIAFGPNPAKAQFTDANSDGRTDMCSGNQCVLSPTAALPDYLLSLADGMNVTSSLQYGALSDATIYTKGTGAAFPIVDMQNTTLVAKGLTTQNGDGGSLQTSFKYESLKLHLQGQGSLGFGAVTSTDPAGVTTRLESRQDYPYTGLISRTLVTSSGATVSDTTQTYSAPGAAPYFIQPLVTTVKSYDLDGSFINWVETTNSNFDAYNNPGQTKAVYRTAAGAVDGYDSTTVFTYAYDTANWILSLPTTATITRNIPGQAASTRSSSASYNATNPGLGLPQQSVIEPDNGGLGVTNLKLTTDYTYDAFGNLLTRTVSGANIAARTEVTLAYDTQGRFVTSSKNALMQEELRGWDASLGLMTSRTDINGLVTTWTYDEIGRPKNETRADGTRVDYQRSYCSGCTGNSVYQVYRTETVAATGANVSPPARTYFNRADQPILSIEPGVDGLNIFVASAYNSLGHLDNRTRGYRLTNDPIRRTWFAYDALGRETARSIDDGTGGFLTTTARYNGRKKAVLNADSVQFSKTIDSQGSVVSVTDGEGSANQSTMAYEYDHWGNLTKTTDAAGNITTIAYDLRGRKTQLNDADLGVRKYTVIDNLGQVLTSVDAKNQTTTFTYDVLGRMRSRTEADLTSNWYYDADATNAACGKGIGKLCQATASNGYSRKVTYDTLSRPSAVTTHIDADYTASSGYDAAGRLATRTFPASTGTPLAASYVYSTTGLLQTVKDAGTGTVWWSRSANNADGATTQEQYGNGLIGTRSYDLTTGKLAAVQAGSAGSPTAVQDQSFGYDRLARLTSRADNKTGSSETFAYDALNRLSSTVLTAPGVGTQSSSFSYDAIGNITSKSGVGTYAYSPARPHAVSGVTGSVNGVANPSFNYDANGNMNADGTRAFTWTSFDMLASIVKTAQTGVPGAGTATFLYGADHQRVKQTWSDASHTVTTVYLDGYEKVTDSATGVTSYRHYATVAERTVAIVTRRSNAADDVQYVLPDHLGSTSIVTDANGAVVERMAYDTWGDRRTASGASTGAADPTNAIQPTSTIEGYTGHEMLDAGNVGLVHMNARLYDPTLGRFISADTLIGSPFSTQSFNRYSYVWNDPLNATDPTGHLPAILEAIGDLFSGLGSGASNVQTMAVPCIAPCRVQVTEKNPGPPVFFWGPSAWFGCECVSRGPRYKANLTIGLVGAAIAIIAPAVVQELWKNRSKRSTLDLPSWALSENGREKEQKASDSLSGEKDGASNGGNTTPGNPDPNDDNKKQEQVRTDGVERHSGKRLRADGISTEKAEAAVREDIKRRSTDGSLQVRSDQSTAYQTTVDGKQIEYRVIRLSDGSINVGTIFPLH